MAAGVLLWTQYTVAYSDEETEFGKFLVYSGRIVGAAITLLAVINLSTPILFTVDEACVHSALPLRYVILTVQILLLLLISGNSYTRLRFHEKNGKYLTLALCGLIMASFLFAQLFSRTFRSTPSRICWEPACRTPSWATTRRRDTTTRSTPRP